MTPAKRRRKIAAAAGVLLVLAAIVAAMVMKSPESALSPRPASERPQLLLLTSLPILFPEGMSLDAKAPPVLDALRSRYAVVPISVANAASLDRQRLLLMAQPQAQPGEALVELDAWVRGGGRVLLLADPALEWPSERPLGSLLRPPLAFPDTGLLTHWGLRLDAPDALGPKTIEIRGAAVRTASPGELVATAANCSVESGFIGRCDIGKGKATVIADADFIDRAGSPSANLGLLLGELGRLEH